MKIVTIRYEVYSCKTDDFISAREVKINVPPRYSVAKSVREYVERKNRFPLYVGGYEIVKIGRA